MWIGVTTLSFAPTAHPDRAGERRVARGRRAPLGLLALVVALAMPAAELQGQIGPEPAPSRRGERVAEAAAVQPAERAVLEGRFDEALALVAERPAGDVVAFLVRGRVARARGDWDEAERWLRRGVSRDPSGEAALELGLLLQARGRTADAAALFRSVAGGTLDGRDGLALARAARARHALGEPRQANGLFRAAVRTEPEHPAIHTWWGELFLEKHNTREAVSSFQTALANDARWTPALLGLARAQADEQPAAARETVGRLLEIDPRHGGAHRLLATLAMDEDDMLAAREALGAARARDPLNPEAAALAAAIAYIEDRPLTGEREAARGLLVNPHNADVHRIAGERLARRYRFDEAVALLEQAVARDAGDPRALAALGLHLMRTGDEAAARASLTRAFDRDPYDVVTFNLLGLLDTLDEFQTVEEGQLVVRMHPRDMAVLRGYLLPLAEEALSTLSARYGMTVEGPILIEVFGRHDDFAVRTMGLPGLIGALGASFGRVVTMNSPRAGRPFNWSAVLWHELAHVVTLQLSRQRLPRWLSEGVSVFEESRVEPAWGREAQLAFVQALANGETLPIAELNRGFSSSRTIARTYFQASLVVAHLVETYEEPALRTFIRAFGDGLDEEAAARRAFGEGLEAIQQSFDVFVRERYKDVLPALERVELEIPEEGSPEALVALADRHAGSYLVQMALARRLMEGGQGVEARRLLIRAAGLVPFARGEDGPHALLAGLAVEADRIDEALVHLDRQLALDHTSIGPVRQLLHVARERADADRLEQAARRLVQIAPFDGEVHATLGHLALARGDLDTAVRELHTALDADPADPAATHADLAEAYWQSGRVDETKRHAIAALETAPRLERAQDLLLAVVDGETPPARRP